jgi:hypothetical protein
MLRLSFTRATQLLFALTPALAVPQEPHPVAQSQSQSQNQDQRRPADHPDRGLPDPAAVWAPWHHDPGHPTNAIFRAIYLVEAVPTEVAAALPREHGADADFYEPGWYFHKRPGAAADRRLFGGDGRQMPREGFTEPEAKALLANLQAIDGAVATDLVATPRLAIWFQHDLLRLCRRLLDTKQNPELLQPLLACARRVALPAVVCTDATLATFAFEQPGPHLGGLEPGAFVEIERRSTRLFDAEHSLHWSSVFVGFPADAKPTLAEYLAALAAAGQEKPPELPAVPLGAVAVLLQGLVAVDAAGAPRATSIVTDVRTRILRNREPLARANATTTHDGVDIAMWLLPRAAVQRAGPGPVGLAAFRSVPMDDQDLFRDYGTLKHTTVAAQCSLCHRRSNTPEEPLAGFSSLRPGTKPRPVVDAGERRRRAEAEFARFLAGLPR